MKHGWNPLKEKKKEVVVVVNIHNYYSAIKRKAFESVLMRWLNLEPIIQSEISQKNEYRIYMESKRWNLFSGQQWRCRHREQTYGQGEGKERVK